jgi:dethiobiotin synthetase
MNSHRLFIAGTDTGVGKTRIATGLCIAFAAQGHRVAALKPVASGATPTPDGLRNSDALALLSATTVRARYADVNPYAFEPAIAPHIAAMEAGCIIDFAVLDRCYEDMSRRSDVTVVEGSGGWLTPLDAEHTFADLAVRWHLDVILVVGLRLGCLNHALLSVESIERRGLRLSGWVGNAAEPGFERQDANVLALRARIAAPCLGTFGHSPASGVRDVAKTLMPRLAELVLSQPP